MGLMLSLSCTPGTPASTIRCRDHSGSAGHGHISAISYRPQPAQPMWRRCGVDCLIATMNVAHAEACIRVGESNSKTLEGWSAGLCFEATQLSFRCRFPHLRVCARRRSSRPLPGFPTLPDSRIADHMAPRLSAPTWIAGSFIWTANFAAISIAISSADCCEKIHSGRSLILHPSSGPQTAAT